MNIQVIDGAANATFSIFQAMEEEFAVIFPDERDLEIADDLIERVGQEEADRVLGALWELAVAVARPSRSALVRVSRCSSRDQSRTLAQQLAEQINSPTALC